DYSPNENWMFGLNFEDMEAETDTAHDLNGDDVMDLTEGMRLPHVVSPLCAPSTAARSVRKLVSANDTGKVATYRRLTRSRVRRP
ncbi:MAG: hypothetical protein WD078_06230, partial [Woeseia sp.]